MPLYGYAATQASPLFSDMTPEEITRLCELLHASERRYPKGASLISPGDPLPAFGLLLSGTVQVSMDDVDGNHIVMANVIPGATFAEALVCSGAAESPICAAATQDCAVLWLQGAPLTSPAFFADPLCARFAANFIRTLSHRILQFNDRVQILSKKTIREKLITLFSQQVQRQRTRQIVLDMDRSALADYLGTDRSALSRELSRMKHAGMISYWKNQFYIHHT